MTVLHEQICKEIKFTPHENKSVLISGLKAILREGLLRLQSMSAVKTFCS